jgi:hypothetical protein
MYYAEACELAPENVGYRIALCRQQLQMRDDAAARETLDIDLSTVCCLANLQRIQELHSSLHNMDGYYACVSELWRCYRELVPDREDDEAV